MELDSGIAEIKGFHGYDHQKTDFKSIRLFEFLENDDRAIFVIDLIAPPESNPIYWNPVLRRNKGLKDRILGLRSLYNLKHGLRHSTDWTYLQWQRLPDTDGHAKSCHYVQIHWIATTVGKRWRVLSGNLAVQNIATGASTGDSTADDLLRAKKGAGYSVQTDAAELDDGGDNGDDGNDNGNIHHTKLELPPNQLSVYDRTSIALSQDLGPSTSQPSPLVVVEEEPVEDAFLTRAPAASFGESLGAFDWTRPDPAIAVTSYVKFFRNFDWESTELGPIWNWSAALRGHVLMLLVDPRPAAMYVGPKRLIMYNEEYRYMVGSKHPSILGTPFHQGWAELSHELDRAFSRADMGLATQRDDACFFIERAHFCEECYFRLSMIPLPLGCEGMAIYNPVFETTRQFITHRRMNFLLSISSEIAGSREPKDFWGRLLKSLEQNLREVPFAILYSATESMNEDLSTSERIVPRTHWAFEGSVGYPKDHPIPKCLDPDKNRGTEEFLPSFCNLIHAAEPTLLRRSDGSLPEHLVDKIRCRAFGDQCEAAIFIPVTATGNNVLGFLLLGLEPKRPYDNDYALFFGLLNRQLALAMAAAVLFETELRTSRIAAERAVLDRDKLTEKLLLSDHEVKEAEQCFRKMADLAPVGIFYFDASGMPIYCNDYWYSITEHPRGAEYPMSWYNVIHPDDYPVMDQEWAKLGAGISVTFDIRLRKPFKAAEVVGGERVEGSTWILAAAYSMKRADGTITAIVGCLTDISRQKWAEDFQTRQTKEALEMKRQQENFIDMTSHEMRNPLSAIVQCADFIGASLGEFNGSSNGDVTIPKETIDSNLDAAHTIALCAQHQKRIIDDVLTFSKLDSNLLLIIPCEVQPAFTIENSLKMFATELRKGDVMLRFKIEPSYTECGINWVKLDPSRLLQVLINLLSNAIKFTSTQPDQQKQRQITVSVGASLERPTEIHGVKYLARNSNRHDVMEITDWGTGDLIYLQLQVQDTGRGLHEHERKILFQRFSQRSPRTHVQYGGSGLGLFISRKLTELQGGEIGVQSEAGVGSTFAFFVKARRTNPPGEPGGGSGTEPQFGIGKQRIVDPAVLASLSHRGGSSSLAVSNKGKVSLTVSNKCKHVLVVEDNLVNQKVLSKQLKTAGCIVLVANHGEEALTYLEKSRFWAANGNEGQELSIVLMDLEMPIMDGLTCVKQIRELQRTGKILRHVPVIAVTANARNEQVAMAKDSGMDGVVTKPFRLPELIPEMERLVHKAADIVKSHS